MWFLTSTILFPILLSGVVNFASSANILAVFPHTGKSHFDVFEPLMTALVARGHNITVISFFPQKTRTPHYNDISISGVIPLFVNALKFEHLTGVDPFTDFMTITEMGVKSCEPIMTSSPVQSLLNSSQSFDLLFIEMFNTDCFLAFVEWYKVPYIGISSSAFLPFIYPRIGSFDNPSYFPNSFFPFTSSMSFSQRVMNTVGTIAMRTARPLLYSTREHEASRRAIRRQVNIEEVANNMSLVFVNSHFTLQGSRPLVPAAVEVGGLHIRTVKPLPQDLDKFLNDSTDGVLLFSMGSVLQSSSFPAEKRQAIMDAFAELPIRVIMKWEEDTLPGKPDNVKLSPWLPQRDIMAHPRVLAFMGHGGLLSTSEAVYCGLPMVLTPMFGDQPNNVAHLVATGAAVKLPYSEISKETVLAVLRAVLYDPRYRERARTLSVLYKDRPMTPVDTAVYWTEYVIRHRGAPHLRSRAVGMPWYQLWLLDVVAVLSTALLIIVFAVYWLVRRALRLIASVIISKEVPKKKKKN